MRIVFMGSATLACRSLDALSGSGKWDIAGVVTQPDRPRGRGRRIEPSQVRRLAVDRGLNVLTPADVNAPETCRELAALSPDVVVVVAYGRILRREVLCLPDRGCVNLHASLLPKYRGAAPIQWAIADGEEVTGVTTMFMDEGLDTGDIILSREVAIGSDDTGGALHDRLAQVGAELLIDTMEGIEAGGLPRVPQDHSRATSAPKLSKNDGRICWTSPATVIRNRVRAFNPWPCSFCEAPAGSGVFLRILRARVEDGADAMAGQVTEWDGDGPLVQTGQGALRLLEVQPGGRKAMTGTSYMCGHARAHRFG